MRLKSMSAFKMKLRRPPNMNYKRYVPRAVIAHSQGGLGP